MLEILILLENIHTVKHSYPNFTLIKSKLDNLNHLEHALFPLDFHESIFEVRSRGQMKQFSISGTCTFHQKPGMPKQHSKPGSDCPRYAAINGNSGMHQKKKQNRERTRNYRNALKIYVFCNHRHGLNDEIIGIILIVRHPLLFSCRFSLSYTGICI